MSSGTVQGQVSVWVPIVVGLLGMVGVISGQFVSAWREQRRENIRWCREREKEDLQRRREDYLHWRDKRLEVAVELMISLNKWRELIVDRLREHHGLLKMPVDTSEQLRDVVEETSDRMAQLKLVGTDTIRTLASETVNLFRSRFGSAMSSPSKLTSDEIEQISRELSLKRRDLQEAVRKELGVDTPNPAEHHQKP
ncbi:hypothetical protein LZ318_24535 [Saccharopolyspora indica]|uniref:hypothetical protein n=1 Tax=Saccharopolyspora indica TaxID=1229659 RepID=UPI0022EA4B07|nr:hypothetical protein [Saccharopolyspora indica]MDA3644803.1 hypothetical protein [Saccharopolyspora indica]